MIIQNEAGKTDQQNMNEMDEEENIQCHVSNIPKKKTTG